MIPVNCECDYCEQNIEHGGKCFTKTHIVPCLGFKQDPRGKIIFFSSGYIVLQVGQRIPPLHKWLDDYSVGGKDTPIKITKLTPIEWVLNGNLAIKCHVEGYRYDNSEFEEPEEKELAKVVYLRRNDRPGEGK